MTGNSTVTPAKAGAQGPGRHCMRLWIPAFAGMTMWMLVLLAGPAAAQTVAHFDWFEYSGKDASDTLPASPNDYRNPILKGFYPDPGITRVGNDFYLVTSTFGWFPGIPVFHSRDLVHWTQIGNAIDRPDMLDFEQLGLSRGVFAPTIEEKDGTFYILNTCVDCGWNFVITAKNPAGPWSDPVFLPDLKYGIDPSLFFDDDGKAWIVNNDTPAGPPQYDGHRALWVQQFDTKTLKTFGPRTIVVDGGVDIATKPVWIEGPHIFKKDGWYYLSAAEGGTGTNHSQVIFRSRSVTGPYVPGPNNPILTQRDLPEDRALPITSSGHAQLVTTPDGKWWATFLATRPYAGDLYSTGRETFLLPVEWKDGWPTVLEHGAPIPYVHAAPALPRDTTPQPTAGAFAVREEFDGKTALPLDWMMLRNPRERWWSFDGYALNLTARPVGLGDNGNPSFVARRQQHINASVETALQFYPVKDGERAGLVALQNDDYWLFLGLKRVGGKTLVTVDQRSGPKSGKLGQTLFADEAPQRSGSLFLRIEVEGNRYIFSYGWPSPARNRRPPIWRTLGSIVTNDLTTSNAGGFVGSLFGVFAATGE